MPKYFTKDDLSSLPDLGAVLEMISKDTDCTISSLVKKYLDDHHYDYTAEFTFENLYGVGVGSLRYDFAVFDSMRLITLIEFDGEQHFQEAGSYYNESGKVQIHDDIKNTFALENNLSLLRIPYTECYRIDEILDDWFKVHF